MNTFAAQVHKMPRYDLMRSAIDDLRAQYKKDASFLRAVYSSAYGTGFYADSARSYARTLLEG